MQPEEKNTSLRRGPLSDVYEQAMIDGAARRRAIEALTAPAEGRSMAEVLTAPSPQ